MTRAYRLAVWITCAALLSIGASHARGDDKKNGSQKSKLKGTYTFRLVPATSFAPFVPGSGVDGAPRQDILRVGVFTADGAGNLQGRTIATTDDGLVTVKIDFSWTGTYTLDTQGLGEILINAPVAANINACVNGDNVPVLGCEAFEGQERFAFVVNTHGEEKEVGLIQTDNVGGGAKIFLTGSAQRR
jgi:hypothetical protein